MSSPPAVRSEDDDNGDQSPDEDENRKKASTTEAVAASPQPGPSSKRTPPITAPNVMPESSSSTALAMSSPPAVRSEDGDDGDQSPDEGSLLNGLAGQPSILCTYCITHLSELRLQRATSRAFGRLDGRAPQFDYFFNQLNATLLRNHRKTNCNACSPTSVSAPESPTYGILNAPSEQPRVHYRHGSPPLLPPVPLGQSTLPKTNDTPTAALRSPPPKRDAASMPWSSHRDSPRSLTCTHSASTTIRGSRTHKLEHVVIAASCITYQRAHHQCARIINSFCYRTVPLVGYAIVQKSKPDEDEQRAPVKNKKRKNKASADDDGGADSARAEEKVHIGRAKQLPAEHRHSVVPYFREGSLLAMPLRAYRIAEAMRRMLGPYNFVTPISIEQLTQDDIKVVAHAYARRLPAVKSLPEDIKGGDKIVKKYRQDKHPLSHKSSLTLINLAMQMYVPWISVYNFYTTYTVVKALYECHLFERQQRRGTADYSGRLQGPTYRDERPANEPSTTSPPAVINASSSTRLAQAASLYILVLSGEPKHPDIQATLSSVVDGPAFFSGGAVQSGRLELAHDSCQASRLYTIPHQFGPAQSTPIKSSLTDSYIVSLNNSAAVLVCYGYCCCCRCRMQTLSIRETHRDKSERIKNEDYEHGKLRKLEKRKQIKNPMTT
ncbi:unnamed protein product [Trichogramma brassicae]|uniref:Uncharacterized protein n=1 Tax=Trichogramma brassicae TaxID=86971 RepID=A0A6H5HVF0_9HYME|nr:unnamed protein product [Trichogramma brassicae]